MSATIRKAYTDDAQDCVKLLYTSGPEFLSYLLFKNVPEIYDVLKAMYNTEGTTFSKENVFVEEESNKTRGMVLGFPVRSAGSMEMKLWKCIKKNQGILYLIKYLFRGMGLLRLNPKLSKEEFYIANIAVFKEYRGRGIAVKLLKRVEESALEKGLKKLSLYVEIDNVHAKSIYEKFGFQEAGKAEFPNKYRKYNLLGFYKMTKTIGEN